MKRRASPLVLVAALAAALAAVVAAPRAATAQVSWASEATLSFEAWGGVFRDAFDAADGGHPGLDLGLRVGYGGYRLRVFQDVGIGRTAGIANDEGAGGATVRHEWLFTSSGLDYPVRRGETDGFLRLGLGLAWLRTETDRGHPSDFLPDVRTHRYLVAGVVLRRDVADGRSVALTMADRVFDLFSGPRHGFAASLGFVVH